MPQNVPDITRTATRSGGAPTSGGRFREGLEDCQRNVRSPWHTFVMTEIVRCRWCRRVLPEAGGRGRPRQFCSQKCRQWDWVARQRSKELALSEGELVIARTELDALHDDLYVLACAVDDTRRDLADGAREPAELRRMLDWLLEAAGPLRDRELSATNPR